MVREARNRNNVSCIVELHSSIFTKHKIKEMNWNMLMTEVGNVINKRRLQCCVDELQTAEFSPQSHLRLQIHSSKRFVLLKLTESPLK